MERLGRLTTITFDADDTLWDFGRVMRHSLRCALDELQRLAPEPARCMTVERMIGIRQNVAASWQGKIADLEQVRYEAFRETLRQIGKPDDDMAAHLNAIYLKHRYEDLELYDDVLPTLERLGTKFKLGILSNGNSYPDRCGLGGRFDYSVFAPDYGYDKPDKRLFAVAREMAGCEYGEWLHVGDSLANDVAGANGAGIFSVWLNRSRKPNQTGIRPDAEISSLAELPVLCGLGGEERSA